MQMIFTWNQFRLGEYLQLLLSRHLLNKFVLSHYFLNKHTFQTIFLSTSHQTQVESNEVGRKESITIDIEAGESSDLVEEVLNLFKYFSFAHRNYTCKSGFFNSCPQPGTKKGVC